MKTLFLGLLLSLTGCAHSYYYVPEVKGDGAMSSKGGVVYSLPPAEPIYKMKVAYLGISDEKVSSNFNKKEKMLRVRLYLLRKSNGPVKNAGFIDPQEQSLDLDSSQIHIKPSAVFARTAKKPVVELAAQQKQAVDFFFSLPPGNKGTLAIQHFALRWTVHYDGRHVETQNTRFDREDSRPQGGAEMFPEDGMYPYYESAFLAPGPDWMMDDWGFWGV